MSCFNDNIAIGVTTDFEHVDLETRFQMWGMYLWLNTYRVFTRMLCQKQGDENNLNLPISYHPYYAKQTFQVGKRKMDCVVSLGKNLNYDVVEQIRAANILNEGASVLAYGLQEESREEIIGRFRKKTIQKDSSCYDGIIPVEGDEDKIISDMTVKAESLLNPFLLAEGFHYKAASQPQNITKKPYIMLYASDVNDEVYDRLLRLAELLEWDLLVNDCLEVKENAIKYSEDYLDCFYGVLMGAEYVVTDSYVVAGLATIASRALTILDSDNDRLKQFIRINHLEQCEAGIAESKKEITAIKTKVNGASVQMSKRRFAAYRALEDMMGLTRHVDCPTNIRMADCYGCYACKEICPKDAITMKRDGEGFDFPCVDKNLCVDCGLCERICIARENKQYAADRISEEEKTVLPAARIGTCLSEEQLATSTSGGVFQSLARYTIENKQGVVVGACFDENAMVITDFADTTEKAMKFSGSKYVRRELDGAFPKVKEYLEEGREVLFSGLPCECAGLRAYLGKDYDNLFLCEILCHGGASPKVYEKYIAHISRALKAKVKKVNFRDKSTSWLQKDFMLTFDFYGREPFSVKGRRNNYMNSFLKNYIFRISCYRCQYTKDNRVGDITIGDCHGKGEAAKELFNEKGISMAVTSTTKGEQRWKEIQDEFRFADVRVATAYAKNHIRPSVIPEERAMIMAKLDSTPINSLLEKYNAFKVAAEKED